MVLIGLMMSGCLATVRGQVIYSTPYTFITIAGTNGINGSTDGTNHAAQFSSPEGIVADQLGNLYVADHGNSIIRKLVPVGTNWIVTTIAGTAGMPGSADGTNAAARFSEPDGIALDGFGNLYVSDYFYNTIRKLTPVGTNWVVTTIAGYPYSSGSNDGTNANAQFNNPSGLTVDTNGNLYVADYFNSTIRKITPVGTNWVVTTIAGSAQNFGSMDGTNGIAQFFGPSGITLDALGNLYVADTINATIRKIAPVGTNWVVTTIAGQVGGAANIDGTNLNTQFNLPYNLTADSAGNLYVADTDDSTIRKIAPVGTNWVVSTLAGVPGNPGAADGTGTNALFNTPYGITVDASGNLYVTDSSNDTVSKGQLATVVPPPPLTIGVNSLNNVVVSWPNLGSYNLQTNANLATTNWGVYTGAVLNNGTNSVTIAPPVGNLFFRLSN